MENASRTDQFRDLAQTSTREQARRLIGAMQRTFDEAGISEAAIAALGPAMTNAPADRHMLAAATAADDVGEIVTFNLQKDFRTPVMRCVGRDRIRPS